MANPVDYSTFEGMISQTLMQPETDAPNRLQVWNATNAQVQLLFLGAQNTDVNWGAAMHTITTAPNQRDYLIPFDDFGKDIAIYTKDTSTRYHVAREVLRVNFQDANLYYSGPATGGGARHSDACVTFYRDAAGDAYCRIIPTPSNVVQYEILYKTDSAMLEGVGDALRFPHLIHLLRFRVCIELLPYCKWSDLSEEQADKRMLTLATMFDRQDVRYSKEYEAWVEQDHTVGSFARLGYAEGLL